jgi:hypothetical protein
MVVKVKPNFVFVHAPPFHGEDVETNLKTLENDFLVTEITTSVNKYFLNTFNLLKDKNTPQFTQ